MANCGCQAEAQHIAQRRVLIYLLLINAMMFVVEVWVGLFAHSTALMADALDMFADATVYGVSLYAVGKSSLHKTRAAFLSGIFQVTLAGLVLFDVIRKFLTDSHPESALIVGIGGLALTANIACLKLIAKHRQGEVHMRASWIFSRNDVISNIGVIVAGVLVNLLHTRLPDLIIGLVITILVLRGGIQIIQAARVPREPQ